MDKNQTEEKREWTLICLLFSSNKNMKKLSWFLLAFGLSFLVWGFATHASSTDLTSSIFKIQAYSYNKISDMYTLEQYGSAVLVAPNVLLTNAHVITDDNDNLTLQYEACQTVSDQEAPKCFSVLQLLKYDKNADLALLQIVNPSSMMPNPVSLWSGTLSIGANIRITGYPANGGDTITTTQGTIAWFEDGYYKTDANVDEWNSWGGSFDGDGSFIGIPTYVINGQTTLGYIIPISTIKDFIGGKFGTTYKIKYASAFDKRLKSIYTIQDKWLITNSLFTTTSFIGSNLALYSALEKKNNNLYMYSLHDTDYGSVTMRTLIASDNTAITRYINNSIKSFTDNDFTVKKGTKKIGTTSFTTILFSNENFVGYDYIQTSSTTKTHLEFIIFLDKESASDLSGLMQFVESTIIKKSYTKPQVFNIPAISLSSKRNISIVKWIQNDWMYIWLFPADGKYVAEVSAFAAEKWDTIKKATTQFADVYDYLWSTAVVETSKYPTKAGIISVTDENDKESLIILGLKKSWTTDFFVSIEIALNTSSAKAAALTMAYKVLWLE